MSKPAAVKALRKVWKSLKSSGTASKEEIKAARKAYKAAKVQSEVEGKEKAREEALKAVALGKRRRTRSLSNAEDGSNAANVKKAKTITQEAAAGKVVEGRPRSRSRGLSFDTTSNVEEKAGTDVVSNEEYRKLHDMEIQGRAADGSGAYVVPEPIRTFENAPFDDVVLKRIKRAGFKVPSPIQAQSWPITLSGRDIVSVARTGSGKTMGFLLPAFVHGKRAEGVFHIKKQFSGAPSQNRNFRPLPSPKILVLAPTRELAMQIHREACRFGACQRVRSEVLYGGAPKRRQIAQLENDKRGMLHIVIATPGRLNDLVDAGKLTLLDVSMLILDEADRMLDMGFGPQLEQVLQNMPRHDPGAERPGELPTPTNRQTLFFTATWPNEVQRVARKFLTNPVQINVGSSKALVANESVTQFIEIVPKSSKYEHLMAALKGIEDGKYGPPPEKIKHIIFVRTKRDCDDIANKLWKENFNCDSIHGDKEQRERTKVLNKFKNSQIMTLIATDVAARGLDVKDITHVINYDFPLQKSEAGIEDYVHRIGRTGRAGRTGIAITFFTAAEKANAPALVKLLEDAKQIVPDDLRELSQRASRRGRGGRGYRGGRGGEEEEVGEEEEEEGEEEEEEEEDIKSGEFQSVFSRRPTIIIVRLRIGERRTHPARFPPTFFLLYLVIFCFEYSEFAPLSNLMMPFYNSILTLRDYVLQFTPILKALRCRFSTLHCLCAHFSVQPSPYVLWGVVF